MSGGPFAGLRVVDLSDRLSGAFAARLFADHGADVVMLEPPSGHPLRAEPPFVDGRDGPDRSLVHGFVNWSKSSVVVTTDEEVARAISGADVVVTTGRPVVVPAGAVHLSVTPHGLVGPLADVSGNHLTACARTGWAAMNAFDGEPPVQLPQDVTGHLAGIVAFGAAAAVLFEGIPELVDVSELEVLTLTTAPWAISSVFRGEDTDAGPGGHRHRGRPGPLYDAAGGRICLGFGEWKDWPGAMRLLGLPELADDPDLVPAFGRHQQDLRPVGESAARMLRALDRWMLFRTLGAMRCGSGCVQDMADLLADEQFSARRFLVPTEVAGRAVSAPGGLAKTTPGVWQDPRPAPSLGTAADVDGRRTAVGPEPTTLGDPNPAGPLHGVRVLTFTQAWSGTLGTELLAFLGADVVQIELLHRSDIWRNATGGIPDGIADPQRRQVPPNVQGLYNSVNLDKRALALDMTSDRGRELFWRLVPRFDVVAENFAPHVMPGWGITLEALDAARPGIVFASLSGYGLGGPHTSFPANGSTIEPMSGLASLHGYPDAGGMNTGGLLPDPTSGMVFAAAVVVALHEQRRTGTPQRVDVAMTEAMALTMGDAVMEAAAGGGVRQPAGNRHRRVAPHGYYPAAREEWVAIAAEDERAWQVIAEHLDLATDERFATMASRKAHEDALDAAIGAATATRDARTLTTALSAGGVTAAPMVRLTDVIRRPEPHLVTRGFLTAVDHPESGRNVVAGRPWRFGRRSAPPLRPAPCVGEHSRAVLVDELGLTGGEYDELVAAGVTGTL